MDLSCLRQMYKQKKEYAGLTQVMLKRAMQESKRVSLILLEDMTVLHTVAPFY